MVEVSFLHAIIPILEVFGLMNIDTRLRTSKKSRFFLANGFSFSEWTIGGLSALGYLSLKAKLRFWPALIFIS